MSDEAWAIWDGMLKSQNPKATGNGIDTLVAALPDNECAWAVYQYDDKYLVRIKWRPDGVGGLQKMKANQSEQQFLSMNPDSKVTVEVLGKKNLNRDQIFECVRPGSGTKVIQDPF